MQNDTDTEEIVVGEVVIVAPTLSDAVTHVETALPSGDASITVEVNNSTAAEPVEPKIPHSDIPTDFTILQCGTWFYALYEGKLMAADFKTSPVLQPEYANDALRYHEIPKVLTAIREFLHHRATAFGTIPRSEWGVYDS